MQKGIIKFSCHFKLALRRDTGLRQVKQMEVAKLALEFIKVLIWPTVLLFLLFRFRSHISQLFTRISASAKELDLSIGSNSLKVKIVEDTIHEAIEKSVMEASKASNDEQVKEIVDHGVEKVSRIVGLSPLAMDILLILGTGLKDRRDERSIQILVQQRYALQKPPTNAVSDALQELEGKHLVKRAGVVKGSFYPPPIKYRLTSQGEEDYREIKKSIGVEVVTE